MRGEIELKSTYKLMGILWDGLSIPDRMPDIFINSIDQTNQAAIGITKLFSANCKEDMDDMLSRERVTLLIDYIPQIRTPAIMDFYAKRILQMVKYLQMNNVEVKLVVNRENATEIIKSLQKCNKKTSHRLLAQSNDVLI